MILSSLHSLYVDTIVNKEMAHTMRIAGPVAETGGFQRIATVKKRAIDPPAQ
jgi:hypothetical protein